MSNDSSITSNFEAKKDKIRPVTCHEGTEGKWKYISTFFNLSTRREWVVTATFWPLYPRKLPGTHCLRLGVPQGRCGWLWKIHPYQHSIPEPSSP